MREIREYREKILENKYSYGTGSVAVANNKIKMKLDEYGEYQPDLSKISDTESTLLAVVPNSNESLDEDEVSHKLYASIPGIKYDKRIGYYKDLYAGHVVEGDYRLHASSGGFGTWIFKELFRRNLIDGVIHVKENKDKDSPILFKYDISRSVEEIKEGAKTKYYPVELSEVLNLVKKVPGRYAVIGVPSFILAIRLLAEQDFQIKERIIFTIGLICGHQKSEKFAESLAWQVGITPGNLKFIDFRKKLEGEPANNYGVEFKGVKNGKEILITKKMQDLLGHNWGQGFFKSNASDFTDDVMNETADITIGDAWLPNYISDSKGNNVVLVRNEIIGSIIEDGVKTNKVSLDKIDVDSIVQSQSSHFQHTRVELGYRLYKKDRRGLWRPQKRTLASNKIPIFRKKIQDLRIEMAEKSHEIYKEARDRGDLDYFTKKMEKYSKRYNRLYFLKSLHDLGVKKFTMKTIVLLVRKVRRL